MSCWISMPKSRTNRRKAKTISCPRCGRNFCSEMNILQHMNQPMSLCHVLWHEEKHTHPLHQFFTHHQNHFGENEPGETPEADFFQEGHWVPPSNQDGNHSDLGTFVTAGNPLDQDEAPSSKFTETYKGCSEAFPGGKTFMDAFQMDQYAEERMVNVFFPFASHEEWQFTSWLLCSRLSLKAIDSLLLLNIVSPSGLFPMLLF